MLSGGMFPAGAEAAGRRANARAAAEGCRGRQERRLLGGQTGGAQAAAGPPKEGGERQGGSAEASGPQVAGRCAEAGAAAGTESCCVCTVAVPMAALHKADSAVLSAWQAASTLS